MNISYWVWVCSLTNGQLKTASDAIRCFFIFLTSIRCTVWESSTLSATFPFSLQQKYSLKATSVYVYPWQFSLYLANVCIYECDPGDIFPWCCHIFTKRLLPHIQSPSLTHFTSIPTACSSAALRGDGRRQLFPWSRSPSVLTLSLFTASLTLYFHASLCIFSGWNVVGMPEETTYGFNRWLTVDNRGNVYKKKSIIQFSFTVWDKRVLFIYLFIIHNNLHVKILNEKKERKIIFLFPKCNNNFGLYNRDTISSRYNSFSFCLFKASPFRKPSLLWLVSCEL